MTIYKDERGDTVSVAETEKVVKTTSAAARQGPLGRPVLMVLIGGIFLAMVAWGIAGIYGEQVDNDAPTGGTPTTAGEAPISNSNNNSSPSLGAQPSTQTDRNPTPESGTGGESQSNNPIGTENSKLITARN